MDHVTTQQLAVAGIGEKRERGADSTAAWTFRSTRRRPGLHGCRADGWGSRLRFRTSTPWHLGCRQPGRPCPCCSTFVASSPGRRWHPPSLGLLAARRCRAGPCGSRRGPGPGFRMPRPSQLDGERRQRSASGCPHTGWMCRAPPSVAASWGCAAQRGRLKRRVGDRDDRSCGRARARIPGAVAAVGARPAPTRASRSGDRGLDRGRDGRQRVPRPGAEPARPTPGCGGHRGRSNRIAAGLLPGGLRPAGHRASADRCGGCTPAGG